MFQPQSQEIDHLCSQNIHKGLNWSPPRSFLVQDSDLMWIETTFAAKAGGNKSYKVEFEVIIESLVITTDGINSHLRVMFEWFFLEGNEKNVLPEDLRKADEWFNFEDV